jgi:hypothetical protein
MGEPPAPPGAPPVSDGESRYELIVSVFFVSMVAAGLLLALLCHCYGGTFGSTLGMATIESVPEEGPDQAEERSPKAGAPTMADPKEHPTSELEL